MHIDIYIYKVPLIPPGSVGVECQKCWTWGLQGRHTQLELPGKFHCFYLTENFYVSSSVISVKLEVLYLKTL